MADLTATRVENRLGRSWTLAQLTTLFDVCLVVVDGGRPGQAAHLPPLVARFDQEIVRAPRPPLSALLAAPR